jgi:hypothetical protein
MKLVPFSLSHFFSCSCESMHWRTSGSSVLRTTRSFRCITSMTMSCIRAAVGRIALAFNVADGGAGGPDGAMLALSRALPKRTADDTWLESRRASFKIGFPDEFGMFSSRGEAKASLGRGRWCGLLSDCTRPRRGACWSSKGDAARLRFLQSSSSSVAGRVCGVESKGL